MKKLFFRNAGIIGAFYLGGILGMYTNLLHWQWWIIIVPTLILFSIENDYHQHKNDWE
jgi:ABC-type uncharacterized transport system permease subunit